MLTIAIDITDRKRTENVLREAKEVAELANRTKTDFLANMSHELRTPLNAVIGFSEIIHKQMFGPIGSERYREYARDIYESGTHLLNLINDILDVSKAEAGKIELHEEIVKIDRVIDASVRLIQERARDANLELTMPETSSLPAVRADERRLKQVLLNLLSNAVKFTPAGGRVAIAANATADLGFSLQVSDTGIGIAEADIAKVLSPSVRSTASSRANTRARGWASPLQGAGRAAWRRAHHRQHGGRRHDGHRDPAAGARRRIADFSAFTNRRSFCIILPTLRGHGDNR